MTVPMRIPKKSLTPTDAQTGDSIEVDRAQPLHNGRSVTRSSSGSGRCITAQP